MDSVMTTESSYVIFMASVFGIALMMTLFCCGAWRCDYDGTENLKKTDKEEDETDVFARVAKSEPEKLDPSLQTEYAKSWLEGRDMGEQG